MQRFWGALFDRSPETVAFEANGEVPVILEISGWFPEGVTAKARAIEFGEADIYSEDAIFWFEVVFYDANGEIYIPDDEINIYVRSERIGDALEADRPLLAYFISENEERTEALGEYAADVLVYRDAFVSDDRVAYEEDVFDGAVRFTEDDDGLVIYVDNTFDLTYEFDTEAEPAPLCFVLSEQLPERMISAGSSDGTEVSVYGALSESVSAEVVSVDTEDTLLEEAGNTLLAVDVSLAHEETEEFCPDSTVSVAIQDSAIGALTEDGAEFSLWAMIDGEAELVEDAEFYGDTVYFDTVELQQYVITYSLDTLFKDCEGDTWKITVSYGPDSGIPEDVELVVSEIGEEDDGYQDYVSESADTLSITEDSMTYVKAFDISLRDPETGEEFQPNENVKVSIELMDTEINEDSTFDVVHFGDETEVMDTAVNGEAVEFETNRFSVYVIVATTLEQKLTASDGNEYLVTVTYDSASGIPANAELIVSEIKEDDAGYDQYVSESAEKLDISKENVSFARAFDITLKDPETGEKFQPTKDVQVSIELLSESLNEDTDISVVHFGEETEIMDASINGEAVEFETSGFSVYVLIGHEGDTEVITPRIEFHFLTPPEDGSEGTTDPDTGLVYYTSELYTFKNSHNDDQTSLILQDSDLLEPIEAPRSTLTKYFYGWYTVVRQSGDTAADRATYYWPDDTKRVELDEEISIAPTFNPDGSVASLSWTVNGVTCTTDDVNAVIDADGCAHVYLAPIYSNYHFANFHLGERGSSTSENIMTRKLIVLGNSQQTDVRISDVKSITNDPTHLLFVGWEYYDEGTGTWVQKITSDDDGVEIVTDLTLGARDVDLYPIFIGIRQINYNLGATHNGAEYLAPDYKNVSVVGISDYPITQLKTTTRNGYTFAGWYLSEDAENNGTGTQIAGADGKILTGLTYSENGSYDGHNGVAFKIEDGKLYLYEPLDSLSVYAKWEKTEEAEYKVIIWQQKVTDDKNAADADKKYDYYTHFSLTANPNTSPTVSPRTSDLSYVTSNPNGDFTGFHLGRYDSNVTLDPQGSTVVNVYYDRDLRAINYYYYNITPPVTYYPAYTYTVTTGSTGTQYGLVNDEYVQLTYSDGKWYAPEYAYQYQVDNTNGTYGLVDGNYVLLTPVYGATIYKLTNTLTAGKEYLIVNSNAVGSRYALGHNNAIIATDAVTVNAGNAASGNAVFINDTDVDATSVWTVSGSYVFQNSNYYLRRRSSALEISTTNSNNTWTWDAANNSLSIYYNYYYLGYKNNTFSLSSATNSVYLYVKDQLISGYTYDNNGTPMAYTGDRYSRSYVATGNTVEYTATRFTQSNITYSTRYRMVTWTGLYGQSLAQNGYSWDDVSDYYWREGITETNGTGQTFLDAFIQDTNPYNLVTNSARGNFALYHYRQQLDGSYATSDRETAYLTLGNGNTTFNLTDKFNGFSVSSYNKGTNGFSSTGGSSLGSSTSISSTDNALHVYHTRNKYSLTFMQNYPPTATFNQNGETENPAVHTGIYYGAALSGYASEASPSVPDNYQFTGWYEDASCTVPFNFNSTMPAANKILYAGWSLVKYRVRIDPNGGVYDHINYDDTEHGYRAMLAPTGLDGTYNGSFATFFNNTATQLIGVDQNLKRNYVAITDAEASSRVAKGESVYRYVNMQYDPEYGSYDADLRNALYILDTQDSVDAYYNFYVQRIEDTHDGTALPQALWEELYLSKEKYRPLRSGETYVLLGWYEVLQDGTLAASPFDFSKPTDHATTLQAQWRLDGGYTLQYTTEYYADNGNGGYDYITADLPQWLDPSDGQKYSDQAKTEAMQEPTAIRVNGTLSDEYQFLGWQIVLVETISGIPQYTPLQSGVYYMAGQLLTVESKYSDANMIIHMQAVYEKQLESQRRPKVVNLVLDASKDAANEGYGYVDATKGILAGYSSDYWPAWVYPGSSTVNDDDTTFAANNKPTQILFGDAQSNAAVHLYKYATWKTGLDPKGVNYFLHSKGFQLLGFDLNNADENYIADFVTADGIVAVEPGTAGTLYAVWEPRVYLNFKNETHAPLTFSLSSDSDATFTIVNKVTGEFEREEENPNSITIGVNEELRYAVPYGKGKNVTVSGTNTIGSGYALFVNSTVSGDFTAQGRSGDPAEVTAAYGDPYDISDIIVEDPTGITITFSEVKAEHTLILDDNYDGGQVRERYFNELAAEWSQSYALPYTSTRVGYEFEGWATTEARADAGTVDYSLPTPTIPLVSDFFGTDTTKTLYAVWRYKADPNTVYVYKSVPSPGDQSKEFTFTVSFTGTFRTTTGSGTNTDRYTSSGSGENGTVDGGATASGNTLSKDYTLINGQYLKVETKKETGNNSTPAKITVTVGKYNAANTQIGTDDIFSWTRNANGEVAWRNITFSVVEATETPDYYTTAIEVAGGYPADDTCSNVLKASGSRMITWTDTNTSGHNTITNGHGGTAIFTNTRKTADVTVKKVLKPSDLAARQFPIAITFVDGGNETASFENYTLANTSYTLTSGSDGYTIEDVPTGAVLRLTETPGVNYTLITNGVTEAGGTDIADTNAAYNVFQFTVEEDSTITFTNTLKSQNVRIVVEDDSGNKLDSGRFTFPDVFDGTRYSAADTGLVWAGKVYADTYTLTETSMPDHAGVRYIKLQNPVDVTVTGDDTDAVTVPAGTENVTVTGPGADGYYTITIINPRMKKITLKKVVGDEDTSGSFRFNVTLTKDGDPVEVERVYGETGTDNSGHVSFTLAHNQSVDVYVPNGVKAEIQESAADYTTVTSVVSGGYTDADGDDENQTFTISSVENDGAITYTNKLKTSVVTVKKVLEDTTDTTAFSFTVTVVKGSPVADYPVYTDPDNAANNLRTDANGVVTFTLAHNESMPLTVPHSSNMTVAEAENSDYVASASSEQGVTIISNSNYSFRFVASKDEDVITVTNASAGVPIKFKKIDGYGNALTGATFSLYTDTSWTPLEVSGTPVTGTTATVDGKDGIVFFEKIPKGVYYMKETGTPSGYVNGNTYILLVGDKALAKEELDETATDYLSGITTSDIATQAALYKSTYGNDYDKYAIFLIDGDENRAVTTPDIAKYGILNISTSQRKAILKKIDNSYTPLAGAKFQILRYDRTLVGSTDINGDTTTTFTSGTNGVYFIDEFPYGTYYIHETVTPSGYQALSDGTNWFILTVNSDGVTVTGRLSEAP